MNLETCLIMFYIMLLYAILIETVAVKYDIVPIKPTDEFPNHIFSNVEYIHDQLHVSSLTNGALLMLLKPPSIAFSLQLKVDNVSSCQTPVLKLQIGAEPSISLSLICDTYVPHGQLKIGNDEPPNHVKLTEQECYAGIKIVGEAAHLYQAESLYDKNDAKLKNITENFSTNYSLISLALQSGTSKSTTNTDCSLTVDFGPEHYLAVFTPIPEEIQTTISSTTTTMIPITTVTQAEKKPIPQILEATSAENSLILWSLVFVFSGFFAAALGGVIIFFFLRCKQQRSMKKRNRSNETEVHTAIEHQTTSTISSQIKTKSNPETKI